MAGLLAARVLSEHFEQVTIIERDRICRDSEVRKGVPQARHVHVLLKKGASLLTEFFPDLSSTLIQSGAPYVDSIDDVRWYHYGVWKARFPSEIRGYSQSRPLLENSVRDCISARANIHFIDTCDVTGLLASSDHRRVKGVQLLYRSADRHEEELLADLVVDASGRGSKAPQWLMSLGYGRVRETIVKVDIGYASRIYRHPNQTPDWKALIIYPTPPLGKRGGYVVPIENDCWIVTLVCWLRDYPPNDEQGFLDYAKSLPVPDLYEAIKDAEPVTPIVTHKFPASQRRHYEQMSQFPEGLVILGDAACSFNPIYGQGMTTAALEASTLNDFLCQRRRNAGEGNPIRLTTQLCQQAIAKVVKVPWLLSTNEDFQYPETIGKRPKGMRLLNWYVGKFHVLVGSYPQATRRFYEVLHLLKPPITLFEPAILFAVIFKRRFTLRRRMFDK
jgi:2-polyprenyl-6-methoxyphenol hydroxylase-like FAD-dependent oxidoreductase